MSDCATPMIRIETPTALALEATFDGGRLTSDGGLVWLAKMDSEMGLSESISGCVPEWRTRRGRHSLLTLLKQRLYQIACGYEDQNDSNSLCGKTPCSSWFAALCPRAERISPAS